MYLNNDKGESEMKLQDLTKEELITAITSDLLVSTYDIKHALTCAKIRRAEKKQK